MYRKHIYFTLNGEIVEIGGREALAPLSDTLRYVLRKTGTKVVCAEGDCGACTVMLARAREGAFRSINSCIFQTFSVDGCHLVTVEGLAQNSELHEIQRSMMRNFGGQCGFCTPGFVMSIVNLYEQKSKPSEQNVKNYLTGNLCRCTGYQPIIESALDVDVKKIKSVREMYPVKKENELLLDKIREGVLIEIDGAEFFAPTNIDEAVEYKKRRPAARIVSGATDLGVQINKGKDIGDYRMSLHLIEDLYEVSEIKGEIHVGARATLDKLQLVVADHAPAFAEFLNIFASPQIKNSATLVGNVANGSPIADTTPFLMAMDAQVHIVGSSGERKVLVKDFFKGYKSFDMKVDELITKISWPVMPLKNCKIGLYKVSQRRDLDISCVNTCFVFRMNGDEILEARIALGGVGPTPLRMAALEKELRGQKISKAFVQKFKTRLAESIKPLSDARGTAEFRLLMVQELFQKYMQENFGI